MITFLDDASAPRTTHEAEIDKRISEYLEMEDPDIIMDLRENNHSHSDKYKVFWEQCKIYLQEISAVHERRQEQVTYLAVALSVRDLIDQVKKKCPEGTVIPSEQWTRLQFWPKNPRTKAAEYYQKTIPLKMMVQKRQFRKSHPDSHYAAAVFRYMKEYAVRLSNCSLFICLDDKHRIKVGEPNFPVAAAERGKQVLVSLNQQFCVGDHDFTKFALVPSVSLMVNIPASVEGSWYEGTVHIGLKDAVFEPSSPLRHATELHSLLTTRLGDKSVLFLYTDGGPDHRLTYISVQLSLVALFVNLNLDFLCACRTPPYHSWKNPVERIMSIVNVGLQCVGIMRQEGSEAFEAAIKTSNNLNQLRKSASSFQEEVKSSLQPPIQLLENVFTRLKLKDNYFQIFESSSEDEIEAFWEVLKLIDSALTKDDTTKHGIKDKENLQAFLSHCCQARKYSFCIKKCGVDSCTICRPVRMDANVFSKVRHLPDPMISPSEPDHYLPFDEAMLKVTTEQDCPSLRSSKKKKVLSYSPSVQHVKNTNVMVQCEECSMWRLLFSKRKLTLPQQKALETVMADISYSCGALFDDLDFPAGLESVCVRDHHCGDPIEKLYSWV